MPTFEVYWINGWEYYDIEDHDLYFELSKGRRTLARRLTQLREEPVWVYLARSLQLLLKGNVDSFSMDPKTLFDYPLIRSQASQEEIQAYWDCNALDQRRFGKEVLSEFERLRLYRERHQLNLRIQTAYPSVASEYGIPIAKMQWMVKTAHAAPGQSSIIRWWDRKEDIGDSKRLRSASMAKFLGKLVHKYAATIPAEKIPLFAEAYGQTLTEDAFTMNIVSGDWIVDTYRESYFGSCMHNSEGVEFYARQSPDVVQMLRIESKSGYLKGRALIWHTTCGRTVLDRIYPSDGGMHVDAAREYARSKGWILRDGNGYGCGINGALEVKCEDVGYYPYMDTFMFSDEPQGGYVRLTNSDGSYEWTNLENYCPWETGDRHYCAYAHAYFHEDDMLWVESVNEYVSFDALADHFTMDDWTGEYHLNHHCVEAINTGYLYHQDNECLHTTPSGELVFVPRKRWMGDNQQPEGVVEITAGSYAGEYELEGRVEYRGDEVWYCDDENLPDECENDDDAETEVIIMTTANPISPEVAW